MQRFHFVSVQIIQNLLQCFHRSQVILIFVGHPLLYMQLVLSGIGIVADKDADIIKTSRYVPKWFLPQWLLHDGQLIFNGMLAYRNVFRMHLMSFYLFTFHGLESSCTYV